eukprot:7310123-Pyramimonas_sp.AAC.2
MRGQADTRLKNTTVGMLRKRCCCEMGWWGYAKRREFVLATCPATTAPYRNRSSQRFQSRNPWNKNNLLQSRVLSPDFPPPPPTKRVGETLFNTERC